MSRDTVDRLEGGLDIDLQALGTFYPTPVLGYDELREAGARHECRASVPEGVGADAIGG